VTDLPLGVKMNKYIVIAFAFLGLWFYEASGGSDFVAGENTLVVFADAKPLAPKPELRIERVTRADTSGVALTDISSANAVIAPGDATSGLSIAHMDAVAEPTPAPAIESTVVEQAAVVLEPVTAPTPEPDPTPDLRFVDGDRVNLRGGPGTGYAVVARLLRNDMVEVLKDEGDGWLHLRVFDTGEEGWIADWLVTAAN
jgi:hypothetical protein